MKRKLLKTSLISLIILMLLQVASFAVVDKITLKTLTDKNTYTIGDKVTVTIDWTEKMECAEFYIKFDSTKLEFEKATYSDGRALRDDFTNIIGEGNLKFGYFGDESTKILFIFEAKATGKTTISVSNPGGFADSNLDEPSSYDSTTYGSKEITINPKAQDKPNGGTNTGNNTTTKPNGGTNIGNNTTTKPSEGTNTGNNTTTKPNGGTNTGNSTTTKPSGGTNTGNNTTTKPSGNTNTGNNTTTKPSGSTNTGNNITTKPSGSTNTGSSTTTKPSGSTNTVNNITTKPSQGTNTENKPSTSNKVDNTIATGKMPQTGAESVVLIMALIVMLGTIGFVKYRRLSDI